MKTLNIQAVIQTLTRKLLLFHLCLFIPIGLYAQHTNLYHKGNIEYHKSHQGKCLGDAQRAIVQKKLNENKARLKAEGKLKQLKSNTSLSFGWPLRAKSELNYNSYYYISAHVDHNIGINNGIKDYNCGGRTYDGHGGTDIVTLPFSWHLYDNNYVEIVAAEAGTITGKDDGNFDKECSHGATAWNAVYIEHADGSETWYGHMKTGSLTSKVVGETVAKGEYLGIVASSGFSNGPHLHFEVYDGNGNLVDPYSGNCNDLNSDSWWAAQEPYINPTFVTLLTHSASPSQACTNEQPHLSNQFAPEQTVYGTAYFRDFLANDVASFRIKKPDGSIWQQWQEVSEADTPSVVYSFLWDWDIPTNEQQGMWTIETDYNGETFSHQFYYGTGTPTDNCPLTLTVTGDYPASQNQAANTLECLDITIDNGENVVCNAGTLITLGDKFHAVSGSTFHAFIDECTPEPPSQGDCELLTNSNFDEALSSANWGNWEFTSSVSVSILNISEITTTGVGSAGIGQGDLTFEQGKTYTLTFKAEANNARDVTLRVFENAAPNYKQYLSETVSLNTNMQTHTFSFTMSDPTINNGVVQLLFGNNGVYFRVDLLSLVEGDCGTTPPSGQTCDVVNNGTFDTNINGWSGWSRTAVSENGRAKLISDVVNNTNSTVSAFTQTGLSIEQGKSYTLSFDAKADGNRDLDFRVSPGGPSQLQTVSLTQTMQPHTYTFTATAASTSIEFFLAKSNTPVYLDNVKLTTTCNNKEETTLAPNIELYPNPATDNIRVEYELPQSTSANILVFDAFGKVVKSITNTELQAGHQTLNMNISDLASGMYFYTLQASEWKATKKFIIVK